MRNTDPDEQQHEALPVYLYQEKHRISHTSPGTDLTLI